MVDKKRLVRLIVKLRTFHLYIAVLVLGVLVISVYIYNDHKKLHSVLNTRDYSQAIAREEKNIKCYGRDLSTGIHRTIYTCEHFLAVGDYSEMYKLAVQNNNKKYMGIYYVIINIPSQAIPLLTQYLTENPSDKEALAYLGYAYYKQKNYPKTIATLSKIKGKDFKVQYDLGVAYEKMGDFTNAEIHYTWALSLTDDPVYRELIKEKLIVLKVSGGEKWIFQQDSR